MKTIEEACRERSIEAERYLEEFKEKSLALAKTVPDEVHQIFRDVNSRDSSLSFGQDLIILGYREPQLAAESRATYTSDSLLATNLPRAPGQRVTSAIINHLEDLKKSKIKVRAVFWGFGNPVSEDDKRTSAQIGKLMGVFEDIDTTYQEKEAAVKQIDGLFTGTYKNNKSISSQLEELFEGKLDEQTLGTLTRNIDSELEKVTLQTGSTGIVRFNSEGNRGYGKVSTNKSALRNEYNAIETVKADGIARVLAPAPIGLVEADNAGALFTWGTENKEMYSEKDLGNYFSVFNTLLFSYAQNQKLNLAKLARDRNMQDVFNRALIHSSGISFDAAYERPSIINVEELEERAGEDIETLRKLREYNPIYDEASKRARDLDPGESVFVHGDARPENIGKDPYGVRPLVDWANAHMGSAVTDLASLETRDTEQYLGWYNFVMDFRGGHSLNGNASDLITCHDVMQPYRTASFKVGKERIQEASRDLKRLERNTAKYKTRFK